MFSHYIIQFDKQAKCNTKITRNDACLAIQKNQMEIVALMETICNQAAQEENG